MSSACPNDIILYCSRPDVPYTSTIKNQQKIKINKQAMTGAWLMAYKTSRGGGSGDGGLVLIVIWLGHAI